MRIEELEGQESLFARDSGSGKTSSGHSAAGEILQRVKNSLGQTFKKSSKRSSKLKNHTFMLLDLRQGAGNMPRPWLGHLPNRKRRNDLHPQKVRRQRSLRLRIRRLHHRRAHRKAPAHPQALPSRTVQTCRHPMESDRYIRHRSLTFRTEPQDRPTIPQRSARWSFGCCTT